MIRDERTPLVGLSVGRERPHIKIFKGRIILDFLNKNYVHPSRPFFGPWVHWKISQRLRCVKNVNEEMWRKLNVQPWTLNKNGLIKSNVHVKIEIFNLLIRKISRRISHIKKNPHFKPESEKNPHLYNVESTRNAHMQRIVKIANNGAVRKWVKRGK